MVAGSEEPIMCIHQQKVLAKKAFIKDATLKSFLRYTGAAAISLVAMHDVYILIYNRIQRRNILCAS
jgi:hypothetical protein